MRRTFAFAGAGRRVAVAAAAVALLAGAAACSKDNPADNSLDGAGKTIKVWLMVDAQSGWQNVVDDATARFKSETGADVKIEYQQWGDRYARTDAALAGNNGPDVYEMGNTDAPRYVFDGAFAPVDTSKFENSNTWLTGLSDPCTLDGTVYCVPYYAGARVLIYRTDLLQSAGLTPPTTYADLLTDLQTLQTSNAADKNFAAFYMPGAYWYAAMAWVYGEGGQIATKGSDGKWTGSLSDPKAIAGLQKWADLQHTYSKGDPTKDENDQDAIFAQGHAAFLYGNGWEVGAVQSVHQDPNDPASKLVDGPIKGKVAAVPMPGASADKSLPSFLGGSVLGVAYHSKYPALAAEWIKIFTDSQSQDALIAKGALPNATALLDKAAQQPGNEATANAAATSWFVPMAPNWSNVEQQSVLQTMLRDIATGHKSVADAAAWADGQISQILNAGS
ncbi:MAG TPA: extracellular solute-binding protein [Micromonosporaceae bacterium]